MRVAFKPVRVSFGQVIVVEEGHYVEEVHSELRVFNDAVYTDPEEREGFLNLCFSIQFDHSVLIRTGPIDSLSKAKQFLTLALEQHKVLAAHNQKMLSKPRIVCDQLDDPIFDWESIQLQNVYLTMAAHEMQLDTNILHSSLATDYLFVKSDREASSSFKKKNALKMAQELNWMAWIKYARWISDEMESLLEMMKLDASSIYLVESLFRDFIQESRSPLVERTIKEIQEHSLKFADIHLKRSLYVREKHRPDEIYKMNEEIASAGRNIYKASVGLKESLQRIFEIVLKLEAEAVREKKISDIYVSMRRMILLYRKILQSQLDPKNEVPTNWSQQVLLRQLLKDELMAVSSINSKSGLEQNHQTFTLQAALLELKQKYSPDRVMDTVFNLIGASSKLNTLICQKGYLQFQEWLKTTSLPEDEIHLHRRAVVIHKLRRIFFRTLMDLCLPIQQICGKEPKEVEADLRAEKSYLNLLPSFLEIKYDDGELEWLPYVIYDPETGEAEDLVKKGYRTLSRFRE